MSDQQTNTLVGADVSPITAGTRIARGLSLLYQAWVLARQVHQDPWQFAVEIGELRTYGLHHAELRWLVADGYAQHADEQTGARDPGRVFHKITNLAFSQRTCFILTPRGADFARACTAEPNIVVQPLPNGHQSSVNESALPRWDVDRRELTLNGQLVKRFRLPAENQERIVATFQEDGWPARIDDPLCRAHDIDPKSRLHESIRALNRNQNRALLRFTGDGTGQGVLWRLCSPTLPTDLP